ncbi:hypothetical protein BJ944DRAFT_244764 [Cunninghamella echinulata]|nr:hypothetical protein BJ944DRAFT_244764 [Cunninghamella echinulata]
MNTKKRRLNQQQQQHYNSNNNSNKTISLLLSLPKELVLEIISHVAISPCKHLYPQSLIELSKTCHYLYHLIHIDTWRLKTLWPKAFHHRFDTQAIYRRQLHLWDWQKVMKLRCKALYACKHFALQPTNINLLDAIQWEIIWDMITEHDERNIDHLLNYQVHVAAAACFQLDQHRDRKLFPVVLPILSLLVNYDFDITKHFQAPHDRDNNAQIVSTELSRFAYNFEAADSLITKHMPLRPFHASAQYTNETPSDDELPLTFYPALDAPAAALHLFFTTVFASHPALYSAIPGCLPIPLFPIQSAMFDVEYLRRYERNLFINAHVDDHTRKLKRQWADDVTTLPPINIYTESGFASPTHFVSEAHHIEGDWLGYYSFVDPDETSATAEDWFDGPMRLSLRIVPLDDVSDSTTSSSLISTSTAATVAVSTSLSLTTDTTIPPPLITTTPTVSSSSSSPSSNITDLSYNNNINLNNALFSLPSSSTTVLASSSDTPWPSRWSTQHSREKRKCSNINNKLDDEEDNVFPRKHLRQCPLTKFEGTGVDNLGNFTVMGLIDDTEDGQVTWEKTYVDSGETWEYSGRFALPMGICGRWGDEEYGGPWWIWKMSNCNNDSVPTLNVK